jgi:hypothetical protein
LTKFRFLGITVTNWNCIHEEIKSKLNSENSCYHSVQSLLSSCLLSKNLEIEIYITMTLPVVLYGCVCHTKGRTLTESVQEQGAEENIWT